MLKVKLVLACLGFAMMLPTTVTMLAQSAAKTPAAPLPSQILTAKKVFISNAGGSSDERLWSGGPAQPYNELYAAIKKSGQYQLVATPADADLILEISFADPLTDVMGSKDSGATGLNTPQLKLALSDPKTNVILWTLIRTTSTGHMEEGRDKALASSVAKLVSDLKALTAPPAAALASK